MCLFVTLTWFIIFLKYSASSVNANASGREAKEFERRVFTARNFEQSRKYTVTRLASMEHNRLLTPLLLLAFGIEWYVVWERTPGTPGHMRAQLLQLIGNFGAVNVTNPGQVTAYVNQINAVITPICRSPV